MENAHEAYLSLMNSQYIRKKKRRMKLHNAYKFFQERSEDSVWASRALKTADHMLLVASATASKKAGVMIQQVGLQEAKGGLER